MRGHFVRAYGVTRAGNGARMNPRGCNGGQVNRIAALAMKHKPLVDSSGYRQRHVAN
jgi:hypothetical protein